MHGTDSFPEFLGEVTGLSFPSLSRGDRLVSLGEVEPDLGVPPSDTVDDCQEDLVSSTSDRDRLIKPSVVELVKPDPEG